MTWHDEHLSDKELERLLRRAGSHGELSEWLFHLLACRRCHAHLLKRYPERGAQLLVELFGSTEFDQELDAASTPDPSLDEVLDRAQQKALEGMVEVAGAEALWQEIADQPPARQRLVVTNSPRFQTLGLAFFLLDEANRTWGRDPRRAELLTELVLTLAEKLSAERYGAGRLRDLEARALVYRANCRRIVSDLRRAERDLECARKRLEVGSGDPLESAVLFQYEASLRRDQRRFDEARSLVRVASAIFAAHGDSSREVRMAVLDGMILREMGRLEEATELFEELLRRTRAEDVGVDLWYVLHQNLTLNLAESGQAMRAYRLLPEVRRLVRLTGREWDEARVDWLEGVIQENLGNAEVAEARYRAVREFFTAHEAGYDTALVSLDLAALYLSQGRLEETKQLATEMVPLFMARDIHREAAAALALFGRAAEEETATVALIEEIAGYLERARRRPDLPFRRH